MIFQKLLSRVLIVGCVCILTNPCSLAGQFSAKCVPIGVRVRIAPLVLDNWNCDAAGKEKIMADMEKEFMEAICGQFKYWNFQSKEDAHSIYTLTFDVWKSDAGKILLLVWMDDDSPNSLAVDERQDKIIASKNWLGPAELAIRLPNDKDTVNRCKTFIKNAFPENDDDRIISINKQNLHNIFPLAWGPKPCNEEDNTFVLPLSKSHEDLKKSLFCLRPRSASAATQDIIVEGNGRWGKYSDELNEALLAKIQDSTISPNSFGNTILLIFLKEQRPVTDDGQFWWDTNHE